MSTKTLERAFSTAQEVLAGVKADQLDDQSPCQSWKVRDVVNHIIQGANWFGETIEKGEGGAFPETDYSQGDFVSAYAESTRKTLAAFNKPGALDKSVKLPFGEMPAGAFMGLGATDHFTHAWDLARSTGQSTDLDPELAGELLTGSRQSVQDAFRGPDGQAPFGPEVAAPKGACPADQLAAFLGRKP